MEFTVGEYNYKTNSFFDPFESLGIARKLSPAIPLLDPIFQAENSAKDNTIIIVMALSRIPDTDCDQVVRKCLAKISRFESEANKYAPILSKTGEIMYQDISLKKMLDLAVKVIEENLGDFFRTALAGLEAAREPEQDQSN